MTGSPEALGRRLRNASGTDGHRRVDRAQEAARNAPDLLRLDETSRGGETLPTGLAERMRDPWIAAIGVVLDHDEPTARSHERRQTADNLDLPIAWHEMEAVGRDQPVQRRHVERTREVGDDASPARPLETARPWPPRSAASAPASRSTATIRPPGPSRSASASVNAPVPAPTSAHVPPGSTALAQECDVVRVVHRERIGTASPCSAGRPRRR